MSKDDWGNQVAKKGLCLGVALAGLVVIQADIRLIFLMILLWGTYVLILSRGRGEKWDQLFSVAFFGPTLPLYLAFGLHDLWTGEVSCKSRCPAGTEAGLIDSRCFCERTKVVKQLISPMDGKKP